MKCHKNKNAKKVIIFFYSELMFEHDYKMKSALILKTFLGGDFRPKKTLEVVVVAEFD